MPHAEPFNFFFTLSRKGTHQYQETAQAKVTTIIYWRSAKREHAAALVFCACESGARACVYWKKVWTEEAEPYEHSAQPPVTFHTDRAHRPPPPSQTHSESLRADICPHSSALKTNTHLFLDTSFSVCGILMPEIIIQLALLSGSLRSFFLFFGDERLRHGVEQIREVSCGKTVPVRDWNYKTKWFLSDTLMPGAVCIQTGSRMRTYRLPG